MKEESSVVIAQFMHGSRLDLGFCAIRLGPQTASRAYRNAATPPPPGWTGPVFQLVHNYPTSNPGACDPSICKWLGNKAGNFSVNLTGPPPTWGKAWNDYIQEVLHYLKEGQDPHPKN